MNINELTVEKQKLLDTLKLCEEAIQIAPKGKLRIENNKGNPRYFHRIKGEDKKGKYIHRDNEQLARFLAQKDYDKELINRINEQVKIVRNIESIYNENIIQNVYNSLNDYRKPLIDKRFITDDEYAAQWLDDNYVGLGFDPNDDSEHYLENGVRVRSKSEILIGNALLYRKIPFKYEKTIALASGEWVSPDFTCLNTRTRKEIIWEHLGRMGEESYANKNVKKLEKYIINNYSIGDNLIITMETKAMQVSTRVINHTIEKYLIS